MPAIFLLRVGDDLENHPELFMIALVVVIVIAFFFEKNPKPEEDGKK